MEGDVSCQSFTSTDIPYIVDVTLRDGGFINNWQFSRQFITRHLAVCGEIGVNICEVGYVNNLIPRDDTCFLKHLLPMDIRWMKMHSNIAMCVMCDDGKYSPEILPAADDMGVNLVRVVAKYPLREHLLDDLKSLKSKGYQVSLNIAACSFLTNKDIQRINEILCQSRDIIDIVYLADSFGSMLPQQVYAQYSRLNFPKKGFHGHNNMQLALANSLESIKGGSRYLDASFAGMGRGGGNTHMEHLVMVLNRTHKSNYNTPLALEYLGNFFLPEISAKYKWGYTPEQMISGYRNVHPFWLDSLKSNAFLGLDQLDKFLKSLSIDEQKACRKIDCVKIEHIISSGYIKRGRGHPFERHLHQPSGDCLVLGRGKSNSSAIYDKFRTESLSIFLPNEVKAPSIVHYVTSKIFRIFLRASRAKDWLQENKPLKNEYLIMPDTSLMPEIESRLYSLPFTVHESENILMTGDNWTVPNCSTGAMCCLLAAWIGHHTVCMLGFDETPPQNEFERALFERDFKVYEQLGRHGVNLCRLTS